MSVFPIDGSPLVFAGAVKQGVWRRLAQAIDAYCTQRSKLTVPGAALCRCRREMNRCRRLVRKPPAARTGDGAGGSRAAQDWTKS
jgi:hypothetical protein